MFSTCTLNFPGQVSPAGEAAGSVRGRLLQQLPWTSCLGSPPVPAERSRADTFLPRCRLPASLADCCLHWLASLLHTSRRLWTGLCISDLDSVLITEGESASQTRICLPPSLPPIPCRPFVPLQPLPLVPGFWLGGGVGRLGEPFTLSFGLLCGARASVFSAHSIITGQGPPRGLRSAPCPSLTPRTPAPLQGGFERSLSVPLPVFGLC